MKKVLIGIVVLLILTIVVVLFLILKIKTGSIKSVLKPQPGFGGILKAQKPDIDQERAITKTLGPAGGVLFTQSYDGHLISLTIPPDSLTLTTEVSLAPLKALPIAGYQRPAVGLGVYVEPNDNFLSKPAYLTIQLEGLIPQKNQSGRVEWGRCSLGSSGFDADICAGKRKVPFGLGIEPGQVMIFSDFKESEIYLVPTIPIGVPNTYNALIWRGGSFLPDQINQTELAELAKLTFDSGSSSASTEEALSHLVSLGADLKPFVQEIENLKRGSSSFPREILKGAIVAYLANYEEIAEQKLQELAKEYEANFDFVRGSFLPWPRYSGLYLQVKADLEVKKSSQKKTNLAYAKQKSKDPMLQGAEALIKRMKMEQKAKETLTQTNLSNSEKLDAIEVLTDLGVNLDQGEKELIKIILDETIEESKDIDELDRVFNEANKLGFADTKTKANSKILDIALKKEEEAEKEKKCDETHKTLETYGVQCP